MGDTHARKPTSLAQASQVESDPAAEGAALDNRLYAAWLAGDDNAFEELLTRHGSSVRRFLEFYLGDSLAAEEAWSDTFLKVVRAKDSYTPGGNFKGWLITIARRSAQDVRRRKTRWFRLLTHRRESSGDRQPAPPQIDAQVISAEEIQTVRNAISMLTEEHRSIVLLTYQQGLNSVEIADILGLDAQQVRSRLTYARRLLKAELSTR